MTKGYRIVGFRLKTPQGEIVLLARRGAVLAVVGVKIRPTIEAALEAVGDVQRQRPPGAASQIAARRPTLRQTHVRLDLIARAPGR
jgi:putative endonuclease